MKTLLTILAIVVLSVSAFSQAPQGINYQAVIRNTSGTVVANTALTIRLSVFQGTSNGTLAYSEKHSVTTNANGSVNVVIGQGTVFSDTFATINWANGPYFIETAYDVNNSGTYTVLGSQQLMSVPYALYAASSGTPGPQGPQGVAGTNGVSITNSYVQNDSLYVVLSNGQKIQTGYVKGAKGDGFANGTAIG